MDEMIIIPEEELEQIEWRATRGSHFEGVYLTSSRYAQQVVEEDAPRLVRLVRAMKKKIMTLETNVLDLEFNQEKLESLIKEHGDEPVFEAVS